MGGTPACRQCWETWRRGWRRARPPAQKCHSSSGPGGRRRPPRPSPCIPVLESNKITKTDKKKILVPVLWMLIRSALTWLFWICGNADPNPGTRNLNKINKKNLNAFQKGFCTVLRRYLVWPTFELNFSCEHSTYCDSKVWPASGSALVWLHRSAPALI